MATGMTNYLMTQFVNQLLRTSSWTKPTNIYVALFTTQPDVTGGGTEVSGGSYARVAAGPLDADWAAVSSGQSYNLNSIAFPTPTGTWGTVGWFALYDASTVGNMLAFGQLTASQSITSISPPPTFLAGQLTVNVS